MFKKILSVITLALVIFVVYNAFTSSAGEQFLVTEELRMNYPIASRFTTEVDGQNYLTFLGATLYALKSINIWVLLLLIPEQILMYYAAGQIYFAFLKQRKNFKMTQARLTRISLEINFVNHALPSGGASGLAYLIWRLKDMGITAGQISFVHILRYAICALANTVQTFIAIAVVLIAGCVLAGKYWILLLAAAVALGIQTVIVTVWMIVRKQKNIAARIEKHIPKISELMEQEREMELGEERKRDSKEKFSR